MKKTLIVLVLSLIFINSFGQKLTFKDLKGIWRSANTFDTIHNAFLTFIDGNHIAQIDINQGRTSDDIWRDTVLYSYTLYYYDNNTLIHLKQQENVYHKLEYYWFLKIQDGILVAEGDFKGKDTIPKKWIEPATLSNSGSFFKVSKIDTHAIDTSPSHKRWLAIQMKILNSQ